jgi:hypothetical protein
LRHLQLLCVVAIGGDRRLELALLVLHTWSTCLAA